MTYEKDPLTIALEALKNGDNRPAIALGQFANMLRNQPRPIQNPQTFKDKGIDL